MKYPQEVIDQIHALDSRAIVGYMLEQIYRANKKIVAVYADVGSRFSVVGRLGKNELEIGISEQSMIPILGGMAHEGFIPFGIAYAPFITMRAADQIRMTVGEMKLNIKLVGGSAGLVSGNLGAASLALDDIAMMRAIPNMTILCPSDGLEAAKMIEVSSKMVSPVYIRLTGGKLPVIHKKDFTFEIGKANILCEYGEDAIIYTNGAVTENVIRAAKILNEENIKVMVVNMATVKPLDTEILDQNSHVKKIFSVEEHNVIGGLGGAIAEYVSEHYNQRLIRLGIKDSYLYPDTYETLMREAGLDVHGLVVSIKEGIERRD
jgi:transketolase